MHIILSGKTGSPVAAVGERLKSMWGALGTTVFVYDAKYPAKLIVDAVHSVSKQFGFEPDGAPEDISLVHRILEWGREPDLQSWGKIAKRRVDEVTGRWTEMGLFHISVIQNLCFREDLSLFPTAYRVYLLPPKGFKPDMIHSHHLAETALDRFVEESMGAKFPVFDQVFPPDFQDPDAIAKSIFSGFNERFKSGFHTLQ